METNKYFVPDIEDVRVGYECQVLNNGSWDSIVINGINSDEDCIHTTDYSYYAGMSSLRVPYLTKEQIEAEGWTEKQLNNNEQALKLYINEKGYHLRLYENCIRFSELMVGAGMMPCWDRILFEGECKSINEFRYICKLLKI